MRVTVNWTATVLATLFVDQTIVLQIFLIRPMTVAKKPQMVTVMEMVMMMLVSKPIS